MRLRTITAADMQDAMRMVREEIGGDAVIVATSRNPKGKGVTVTVAQEEDENDLPESDTVVSFDSGPASSSPPAPKTLRSMPDYIVRDIEQILIHHGVAEETIEAMLKTVHAHAPLPDDSEASQALLLETTLAASLRFEPLDIQ
ncbi:MAG: hypothetical protein K2Q12_11030, partial [Rickettsiales bacterium]|nr:hypothetical protein [Rickettsiales bacterium]